ncbi:flavin-containing monooxygenase [Roseovarius pelagicus]|uniref:NAD(P)/FAD-dependent oxidoreductase n=1 Tax=Roseovarius pelagicus TaxID=2980108 RepID=A0ABY6DBU0_9RHOB|nr:NAD(P)/FAD-dependent oxidoreductase [Roseovarius pelagicus]UXX83040.1 NAD(P)/FAD-dependent oxidoreductase [Roseovarius pelagicus]
MPVEKINTLVVGGGQAGVAMSEHLGNNGIPHLVLERDRIAERWRTARWDSLVANGPAWHDRFPGMEFPDFDPDAFPGKEAVADYFVEYAKKIDAPIRCGVEVKSVRRNEGRAGFTALTSQGVIEAQHVVAATGPFQKPVFPEIIPAEADLMQIHSNAYRNPDQLPAGAVMVVGAGASGAQIAEELQQSGRQVTLSVGPHDRPPRSYRGRDFVWWLGVLGKWDMQTPGPGTEHVTFAVSGANGGNTVDYRRFAAMGMTLVGRTENYENGTLRFSGELPNSIAHGDRNYLSVLDEADAYAERNGLDMPTDPAARQMLEDPDCIRDPIRALDIAAAGITSVIWATGYTQDYSWLQVDAFNDAGKPDHRRGVSTEPGVYFVGLPWLSRRGSSFIWGVWHDAKFVADHIATQQTYLEYTPAASAQTIDA